MTIRDFDKVLFFLVKLEMFMCFMTRKNDRKNLVKRNDHDLQKKYELL